MSLTVTSPFGDGDATLSSKLATIGSGLNSLAVVSCNRTAGYGRSTGAAYWHRLSPC